MTFTLAKSRAGSLKGGSAHSLTKDTCVVRVDDDSIVQFYPDGEGSTAYVPSWPATLRKKFRGAGIYSICCTGKPTSRSARVLISGAALDDVEHNVSARFVSGGRLRYGLCTRFLDELGVTPPPKGKQKTLHLVVTKRKAKK